MVNQKRYNIQNTVAKKRIFWLGLTKPHGAHIFNRAEKFQPKSNYNRMNLLGEAHHSFLVAPHSLSKLFFT